jgi:Domain of unknown function (DUF4864)
MRTTLARRLGAGLFGWLLFAAVGASAAPPLPETDARAVRAVVQSQLDAMAAGDGERAFSYAAPGIRSQFGSAVTFMAMVQQGYPMVIRPARVAYQRPEPLEDAVLQRVQLRDADGQDWLAAYQLQRQDDGSWRISGCVVRPDRPEPAT